MKRLIIPALAFLVMTSAGARNLSAEASLDHDLWWEAPETPNVKITLTDTTGVVNNSKVTFIVTDDRDASKQILNVTQNVFIPTRGNAELMFDIQVLGCQPSVHHYIW